MDPRARLADLVQARGSSMAALSRMIGRNPSYLQQFITKGSPRKLEEKDRKLLAQFFGISESQLGGPEENADALDWYWVSIPRIAVDASAGPGAFSAEEVPFDSFRFSRRWLRELGLDPNMLAAIRVVGDSMDPLLRDGDEILVDRARRPFRDGIHVLRMDDVLHVKRVQAGTPGQLVLVSANPVYEPIRVASDQIELIGRVVWKGGRL